MLSKKALLFICFAIFFTTNLLGQETTVASGGNISSSSGSVSYSLGQAVSGGISNSNGTNFIGIQQPYEIFVALNISDSDINLVLNTYPNPTSDILKLSIENNQLKELSYSLFDSNGKNILSSSLFGNQSEIDMTPFSKGIYYLNINNKTSKLIKTFKIIKI